MITPRLIDLAELSETGRTAHSIRRDVGTGALVRLRPGIYVLGDQWRSATPEARIVARAQAVDRSVRTRPLFSHETAAAAHGMPLLASDAGRVHVIAAPERSGSVVGVVRHRGMQDDIVEVGGILCTTLPRTVADIARTARFEQAAVVADAALRSICVSSSGRYDSDRADDFRRTILDIAARSAHGRGRAAAVIGFADGRAQLAGESVSRVRLRQLGFRRIDLQVPVHWPGGGPRYFVDFGLDDPGVRALGEFDGRGKYLDPEMRGERSVRDVLDLEKQREDWIRGRTQRPFARWGWSHLRTPAALGARLADFGIRPPL